MLTAAIGPRSFYCEPNPQLDIEEKRSQIFIGTFANPVTIPNIDSIREKIIRANFESKTHLFCLGNITWREKQPIVSFTWEVASTIAIVFYSRVRSSRISTFFLFTYIPVPILGGILLRGIFERYILNDRSAKKNCLISTLLSLGILVSVVFPYTLVLGNILDSVVIQVRKSYADRYVVFHHLSQIPNSMQGFELTELANETIKGNWADPISQKIIPSDQVSASRILLIGKYASDVVNVLHAILKREYNEQNHCLEEIPNPMVMRLLRPEEKEKFLNEISAFFALSNSQALLDCWNVNVSYEEIQPLIEKFKETERIPDHLIARCEQEAMSQVLAVKRKLKFLNLLPSSIQQQYFKNFFQR